MQKIGLLLFMFIFIGAGCASVADDTNLENSMMGGDLQNEMGDMMREGPDEMIEDMNDEMSEVNMGVDVKTDKMSAETPEASVVIE